MNTLNFSYLTVDYNSWAMYELDVFSGGVPRWRSVPRTKKTGR